MSTARIPDGTPQFDYHDLERAALGFALETETWPVFLAWMQQNQGSGVIRDWLAAAPDLDQLRNDWLRHSPSASIRALAGEG